MPIYEYKCPDCDVIIEKMRKISERDEEVICVECGGEMKFGIFEFNAVTKLKGTGWDTQCNTELTRRNKKSK